MYNEKEKIKNWMLSPESKPILIVHGHTCTGKSTTIKEVFSDTNCFFVPCYSFEKRSKVLSYICRVVCVSAIENMIKQATRDFMIFDSFQFPDMIARDLTNVVTQNKVKFVIVLDGDYRSKLYSFGCLIDEIYFSVNTNVVSENKDTLVRMFDPDTPYIEKIRTYDDSMNPIIMENVSEPNYKNFFISQEISHIPYAKAVMNIVSPNTKLNTLKYPQIIQKSDIYVINEIEAIEKIIHRKF